MFQSIKQTAIMLWECVGLSLRNILSNRARSFLTVLGILIGVMAVITLMTTVSGVTGTISSTFSSMGAGSLSVSVTGSDLKSGMTPEDLEAITQLETVDGLTPNVTLRSRISRGGVHDTNVSVSGKNGYYFLDKADQLLRGRRLSRVDDDAMTYACMIDESLVEEYFFGEDPIGQSIYIDGTSFRVVGIYSASDNMTIADMIAGSPKILIPYTTALRMTGANLVTSFTVTMKEGISSKDASTQVEALMDSLFSYEEDCYTVTTMESIENTMQQMMSMMSTLLAGIASIALLVGGIGIMNMMLTTVTERTMEIGLKKAIGAVPWQIQIQFLMESFLLSIIGGIIGIVMGLSLSFVLCKLLQTEFVISMNAIGLGVGFSAAVGIIFGWMPARKASKLNPIDALRSM